MQAVRQKEETKITFLNNIAEKFRDLFVEFAIDWIKNTANAEESRRFELTSKQKIDELNKESENPFLRKSITVKTINGKNYFYEDWQIPGSKMTSHSLGTSIPSSIDLSLYSISDKAKNLLGIK